MKKIISIFLFVVILATLSLPVFAASGIDQYEQAILDKLESVKIVTTKGWKFYFSQENINGARNYFISNEVGAVDEETMKAVISYIDEAVALIKEEAEKVEFNPSDYYMEQDKTGENSGANSGANSGNSSSSTGKDNEKFDISKLTGDGKDKLLDLAQKACDEVDLSVSYDAKNDSIVIYQEKTPVFHSGGVIKSTGEESGRFSKIVFFAAAALPLAAVCAMFSVSKKIDLFVK